MDTANNTYPALQFPASGLSAFTVSIDIFIISLKNGDIVHFKPDDAQRFYDWLIANGVRDIQKDKTPSIDTNMQGKSWKGLFNRKKQNEKS